MKAATVFATTFVVAFFVIVTIFSSLPKVFSEDPKVCYLSISQIDAEPESNDYVPPADLTEESPQIIDDFLRPLYFVEESQPVSADPTYCAPSWGQCCEYPTFWERGPIRRSVRWIFRR